MVAVELSKIIVVTINIIFLVFGLAALIVGIVFKVGWDEVRDAFVDKADDLNFDLQSAGDILGYAGIIFGSFIIVVSLLGCIGACCKLRVLLVLYAIVLIILIVGECAVVGVVATHADEAEDTVGKAMDKSLKGHYYENSTDDLSKGYSALFNKLECCGIKNFTDSFPVDQTGKNTGFYASLQRGPNIIHQTIPVTCCRGFDYESKDTGLYRDDLSKCLNTPDKTNAYTQGCLSTIIGKVDDNKGILIGVGVAILVLELIMVIIAFFLCCRGDKD